MVRYGQRNLLRTCYAEATEQSFQTDEEQYMGITKTVNGKGFSKFDVELLSSFALQLRRGKHLTEKQMYKARPKIQKYAGQLLEYMRTQEDKVEADL